MTPPGPPSRTTPARRARALRLIKAGVVALALVGSLPAGPVEAQILTAEISLVRQPLFYKAGDELGIRVRISNPTPDPLEGFSVQSALFPYATGRIDLHESYGDLDPIEPEEVVQKIDFDQGVDPGESVVVTLDAPLGLSATDLGGVYPMVIGLYDAALTRLDAFSTQAIYYPEAPQKALNLALVVPLSPPAARGPSGGFAPDTGGTYPLEEATGPRGWLAGALDAIANATGEGLSLGLAPSPRLVEELAGMGDGYARLVDGEVEEVPPDAPPARAAAATLDKLRDVLASPRIQPLPSAYANPDLPTIYDQQGLERVNDHLDAGREVLDEVLPDAGLDSPWLYVGDSHWDEKTLEAVRVSTGELKTFVDAALFEPPIDETRPGCPSTSPQGSFTCSVVVETQSADVPAYARDPDVHNRLVELAARDGDPLSLHRFFAETALIHSEQPDAGGRVIHASLPDAWQPSPRVAKRLFAGVARAPWLAPRTPAGGLERSVTPRSRSIVFDADPLGVDRSYFEALKQAARELDTFTELGPPEQRVERLYSNLLVAESQAWWRDDSLTAAGLAFATETEREIGEEFDKITISGPDTTLTSQRSAVEVNVFNETTYPVRVDVDFESSRPEAMRIDESDKDELQNILIEPGSAPAIKVDAIADTSGIFVMKASIKSPGRLGREINYQDIQIRSTNFNRIALGLTLGALGVIVLFYTYRLIRRRRAPVEVTPSEST